jgi:hypothetical protein
MYGSSSENDLLGGSAGAMCGGAEGTQAGVIPRAISGIFELSSSIEVLSLSVHCSFLQIYNEQLFDMLRYLPYHLLPLQKNGMGTGVAWFLAWLGLASIISSSNILVPPTVQGSGYGMASAAARGTWRAWNKARQGRDVCTGAVWVLCERREGSHAPAARCREEQKEQRNEHERVFFTESLDLSGPSSATSQSFKLLPPVIIHIPIRQIFVEQKRVAPDGGEVLLRSKFSLVDLAG